MAELIDRDKCQERIRRFADRLVDWGFPKEAEAVRAVAKGIKLEKTVDAVPVVHGRWERCGGDLHSSGYAIFCSVCNKVHFVHRKYSLGALNCKELFEKPKYCPSCGAIMEIEE